MEFKLIAVLTLGIVAAGISGCATESLKVHTNLDALNSIQLQQGKTAIVELLGEPSEIRFPVGSTSREILIYDDYNSDNGQIAAVELDEAKKTTGITIIPRETDREYNLEYLLKTTFAKLHFEKHIRVRCGADYDRNQTYFLNLERGIAIEQNTRSTHVASYFKVAPAELSSFKNLITACKK